MLWSYVLASEVILCSLHFTLDPSKLAALMIQLIHSLQIMMALIVKQGPSIHEIPM